MRTKVLLFIFLQVENALDVNFLDKRQNQSRESIIPSTYSEITMSVSFRAMLNK